MIEQLTIVLKSLETFWLQVVAFLPRLLLATILLTAGWLVAKFFRRAVTKILRLIRLDDVAEKAGVDDFLLRGGVRFTSVTLVANLVYWFIMFTIILAVLTTLGLQVAATMIDRIIFYVPNVLVAVIVLIFGSLFARLVKGATITYLNNIGITGAGTISIIAQYAILIFVVSVALEQLSIGGQVLISAFQIAFGSLCLALALAFGLGGRDWASQVINKTWGKGM